MRNHDQKTVLGSASPLGLRPGPLLVLQCSQKRLARMPGLCLVAKNFCQAYYFSPVIPHGHDDSAAPETAAILALMPTLIARMSFGNGPRCLLFGHSNGAILRRKDHIVCLAADFGFRKAKEPFSTDIPACNAPLAVHRKDGVLARVLEDQLQVLLRVRKSRMQ